MAKKKVKNIELPMDFNPGTMKFEPRLPIRKGKNKEKVNLKWFWIVIAVILILGIIGLVLYLG